MYDDLYMLEGSSGSIPYHACFGGNKDVNHEIIQWHLQLGHPSFSVHERLFCEAHQYARHIKKSNPLCNNRSSRLFLTIHSDV